MKRFISSFFLTLILLIVAEAVTAQGGYKKLPSGLRYKVINTGKGVLPKVGNAVQVHTVQAIGDSILFSTYTSTPSVIELSKSSLQNDFIQIFMMMRVGDSAVFYQTATELKKQMTELPPFIKEGDTLYGYCKTLRIYPNSAAAIAEKAKAQKGVIAGEQVRIKEYLTKNNIVTQPTPKGCFIVISQPGSGPAVTKGATVSMQYTGSRLDGFVFDSNIDSAFGHPEPFSFTVGTGAVIPGFEEAVLKLKKGGKCKIFIPATLAYGERGAGGSIGPNENLIFDIILTDVVPAPVTPKIARPKTVVRRRS